MTTAPPDTHKDSLSWISFLTPHPVPDRYQAVHRGCMVPATRPCCFCVNPDSKTSLTFSRCPFIKPTASISTNLPFCHVSGGLQLVGDSAAGGLQTNMPRWAEEIRKARRFPLMQSIQSWCFTVQGKEKLGRHGLVPRRSSINAYCPWRLGVPGVGPSQTLNPRLETRTLNRGFQTTKTVGC